MAGDAGKKTVDNNWLFRSGMVLFTTVASVAALYQWYLLAERFYWMALGWHRHRLPYTANTTGLTLLVGATILFVGLAAFPALTCGDDQRVTRAVARVVALSLLLGAGAWFLAIGLGYVVIIG